MLSRCTVTNYKDQTAPTLAVRMSTDFGSFHEKARKSTETTPRRLHFSFRWGTKPRLKGRRSIAPKKNRPPLLETVFPPNLISWRRGDNRSHDHAHDRANYCYYGHNQHER